MIEPLTNSLYLKFNGAPPPATLKGVALTDNGEVYAVAATTFIGNEYFIIFGAKDGFNKRGIIEGWREFKKTLDEHKTYYAIIDRDLETAHSLLTHFNFEYMFDDLYIYKG